MTMTNYPSLRSVVIIMVLAVCTLSVELPLRMFSSAAKGAASLKFSAYTEPFLSRIVMNPPPPIPDDIGCTTPEQSIPVIAASTAEPSRRKMSAAISAQRVESIETAAPKKQKITIVTIGSKKKKVFNANK